eukprot:1084209-Lingulodinium_polyedra.AAC.1
MQPLPRVPGERPPSAASLLPGVVGSADAADNTLSGAPSCSATLGQSGATGHSTLAHAASDARGEGVAVAAKVCHKSGNSAEPEVVAPR